MDLDSLIKRLIEVRDDIGDNVEVLCDEDYLIFRDTMGSSFYENAILLNFDYDHEHLSALTANELEAKKIQSIKDDE